MADTQEALKEAGLQIKVMPEIRHMAEVLVEDFGFEELGRHVKNPLQGLKFAGYVGCQTNRPFGIAGENFENPMYLDKIVETMGGAEYMAGFALVTATLHGVGIGFAQLMTRARLRPLVRIGGAVCVLIGAGLYVGVI